MDRLCLAVLTVGTVFNRQLCPLLWWLPGLYTHHSWLEAREENFLNPRLGPEPPSNTADTVTSSDIVMMLYGMIFLQDKLIA